MFHLSLMPLVTVAEKTFDPQTHCLTSLTSCFTAQQDEVKDATPVNSQHPVKAERGVDIN
jgi:hypothetical protein